MRALLFVTAILFLHQDQSFSFESLDMHVYLLDLTVEYLSHTLPTNPTSAKDTAECTISVALNTNYVDTCSKE